MIDLTGKLIVGTYGAYMILDPETGGYDIFKRHNQLYHWGITWSDKFLVTSVWLGVSTTFLFYDLNFKRVRTVRPPGNRTVIAPHQILWFDGKLWIANSQYDYATIYDFDSDSWDTWRMFDTSIYKGPDKRGSDYHHMNGVWFHDGQVFVCAHNKQKPSFIQVHEYPSMKYLETLATGRMIHNVWSENGEFLTCSSGDGRIVTTTGREVVRTGGFPRGVAITDKYNCIGVSPHHFRNCGRRNEVDGEIHIYDKNWNLVRVFVTRDFGQVYEMRMFGEKDITHWSGSENVKFNYPKELKTPPAVECYRLPLN